MDIGSIVKCIKKTGWENSDSQSSYFSFFGEKIKTPIIQKHYTVRGFYKNMDNSISIYLEEIINKIAYFKGESVKISDDILPEPSFEIECFIEELPPMDIMAEIEKESFITA